MIISNSALHQVLELSDTSTYWFNCILSTDPIQAPACSFVPGKNECEKLAITPPSNPLPCYFGLCSGGKCLKKVLDRFQTSSTPTAAEAKAKYGKFNNELFLICMNPKCENGKKENNVIREGLTGKDN